MVQPEVDIQEPLETETQLSGILSQAMQRLVMPEALERQALGPVNMTSSQPS